MKHLEYFESVAKYRLLDRKKNRYYWDDITRYVNYFCHDQTSVLEIGCGTGNLLNEIIGKKKVGIDFSPAMIKIANEAYPKIEFHVMSAENILLNEKFDLIILSNLIGLVDDIQKVFNELNKVSHHKTKVIINYYNKLWEPVLWFAEIFGLKRKTPIQNWLNSNDVNNLLFFSNFETFRQTKRMLIPIYIPLMGNLFNNYLAKLPIIRSLCLNSFVFARISNNKIESENTLKEKTISIIIPARNEQGNIINAIKRIPRFGESQEIIFVEGNSKDQTWDEIKRIAFDETHGRKIIMIKQNGKGKYDAVKSGFAVASGEVLIILDADLTVPPEELPKFYDAIISNKGDFINGNRLVYPMERQAMRFLNIIGNNVFGKIFSWILDQKFKDTLCGTKVILRSDYVNLEKNRKFFGDFDPFGDFDLLFGAFKLNLKIIDLPIRYKERSYGETNISRFKHGLVLLRMCIYAAFKIKFR